jgi:hypothetical protein
MQSILLPPNYQPAFDLSENAELNAYVLEAGYKIYQMNHKYYEEINRAKQSLRYEDLKKEFDDDIKNERIKHAEEVRKLQDEAQNIKTKYKLEKESLLEEHDKEAQELRQQIKNKKITEDQVIENKCNAIEERYEQKRILIVEKYQSQIELLQKRIEEESKRSQDYQMKLHELHLSNVDREKELRTSIEREYQETLRLERERYNTLSLQHTALTSSIAPKTITTTEIGNIGEEMIEKWTRELFHNADIFDTSGQTAKGDLHVKLNNKLFLFEIKNRLTVQRPDIDKFIRDVEGNASDIHGALFISIGSPAIPNKGDFSLEYISDIPVIYLYVPDKATLKVAIKTLMFLNNRTDNTLLLMAINQTFTHIKTMSSATVSISKSLDEMRVNLESVKREIKNGLTHLEQLFNENPDMKFDTTVQAVAYRPDEIKIIQETYLSNKKAKMDDYAKALGVVPKYLQDRGGAAKIKTITSSITSAPPRMVFNNIPLLNIDSL